MTLTIFKKEFKGIVLRPSFFFVLFLCTLFFGLVYFNVLDQYAVISSQQYVEGMTFLNGMIIPYLSSLNFVLMFVCPFIAIRLFSEEYKQNTFELLLTSPVTSSQIVLGKYLAVIASAFIVVLASAVYPLIGLWVAKVDISHLALAYMGIVMVVMVYCALSIFASSLSSSVIVSGILSIVFILSLWFIAIFRVSVDGSVSSLVDTLWINTHLQAFFKGGFSILNLSIFLSYVALFVFICQEIVESFRWR